VKADSKVDSAVRSTLQTFSDAYQKRNLQDLIDCFSPDGDVVVYGTGADEKRVGAAQIKSQAERDWSQTESASIAFDWMSISAAGDVAWAAVDGAFNLRADGQDSALPARATFILERRDGKWLIVHAHFSIPSASQQEGQSF
jgi:uncharacterized protein (TIGR02246 family)